MWVKVVSLSYADTSLTQFPGFRVTIKSYISVCRYVGMVWKVLDS